VALIACSVCSLLLARGDPLARPWSSGAPLS
jgi:hypothetical protein